MRKGSYFLLLLLFITGAARGQIVAWHFEQAAGSEESYDPTRYSEGLITSPLVRGQGLHAASFGRAFSSSGFTVNGTKADALANNEYITFAMHSAPGLLLSVYTLETKLMRTPDGPIMYRWYYSLDGIDFLPVGDADISLAASTDGVEQSPAILYSVTALQKVSDFSLVTFRLYAWGAASATGSLAVGRYGQGSTTNSLAVNGTVVSGAWSEMGIVDFTGKKEGDKTILNWVTVNEDFSRSFEIMRSADGILFSVVDSMPSYGIDNPGADFQYYSFSTKTPEGPRYYYRLRQLREGGHSKFSRIIMLQGDDPLKFGIRTLFPNPLAGDQLSVAIDVPANEQLRFVITDITGAVVMQKTVDAVKGPAVVTLPAAGLPRGIYIVKMICTGYGEVFTSRFVKQ